MPQTDLLSEEVTPRLALHDVRDGRARHPVLCGDRLVRDTFGSEPADLKDLRLGKPGMMVLLPALVGPSAPPLGVSVGDVVLDRPGEEVAGANAGPDVAGVAGMFSDVPMGEVEGDPVRGQALAVEPLWSVRPTPGELSVAFHRVHGCPPEPARVVVIDDVHFRPEASLDRGHSRQQSQFILGKHEGE